MPACLPACCPQGLDRACKTVAEASIVLQLLGVAWRLLGQLVAVEALVFVIARPKLLQQLHQLLAAKAVSLSALLLRLGLASTQLLPGGGGRQPPFLRGSICLSSSAPRAALPSALPAISC